jgi:uncharacterized membrane protein YbhN (UPF0104 family)
MRIVLRLVAAAAISLFILALLLHLLGGAGENAARLAAVLRGVSIPLLAAYAFCTVMQSLWRAVRYSVLLKAGGVEELPRFGHILLVTFSRNMLVDLLPARLGELSYVAMLNRGYRVGGEICVSSLGISVLFDFVALLFIVAALLVLQLTTGTLPLWLVYVTAVLAIVVAAGLFAVFYAYEPLLRFARPVLARLPRVLRFLEKMGDAIGSTRAAGVLGRTLGLSLLVRAFKYVGFYFAFLAVASVSFPAMAEVPFWKVLFTLLSAEAASSAPIPSFMSFGSYETGGTAMWTLLGFPAADAMICTLAIHICSQALDYTLGGLALLVFTFVAPGRTPAKPSSLKRAIMLVTLLFLVVAAAGFLLLQRRALTKQGAIEAPPAGTAVEADPVAVQGHDGLPRGFMVWSSNRGGNHDIWKMTLPDLQATQMTTHAHTEYYPRISPDGRLVLFSRAHVPWLSQRKLVGWDTWVLDVATGAERLAASNAVMADWRGTNAFIFIRDGSQVVEQDLASGAERVLVQAGQGEYGENWQFTTPAAATGGVTMTVRGGVRMTAMAKPDGSVARIAGGCQAFWTPDGALVYFVETGRQKTHAFYIFDPASGETKLWFDQPGAYSHEYFPRLSQDGRWLAFGATAKGHEHDAADYEIFLWEVGSDQASSRRLTWHTGNDCWPDIMVTRDP